MHVPIWDGGVVWGTHVQGFGNKPHRIKLLGFPAIDYDENP